MNAHPETALAARPLTLAAAVGALRAAALERLADPKRGPRPHLIAVSPQGGLVAPTGVSDNQQAGQWAEENAYQTGATRVAARDLSGACWSLDRAVRREKFAPKTDAAIAGAVRDTLRLNPRMRAAETLVQVHAGVVTLAGTVRNLRTKLDAERDARHVVGVAHVHNLLKVRP